MFSFRTLSVPQTSRLTTSRTLMLWKCLIGSTSRVMQVPLSEKPLNDRWYKSLVPISLACDKITHKSECNAPMLNVTGLYHHRPLDVIKAALQELNTQQFHIAPFKEYWVPHLDGQPEHLYSDVYNSDTYLQEQAVICNWIHEDSLETMIISMMLWSDSTHLTSFGNALLWPIYLYFGNQSKYDRAKPTTFWPII